MDFFLTGLDAHIEPSFPRGQALQICLVNDGSVLIAKAVRIAPFCHEGWMEFERTAGLQGKGPNSSLKCLCVLSPSTPSLIEAHYPEACKEQ